MAKAAELLADEYTLVITNVPFLGKGQQSELMQRFADENYAMAKADLATMFLQRLFGMTQIEGCVASVTSQVVVHGPSAA